LNRGLNVEHGSGVGNVLVRTHSLPPSVSGDVIAAIMKIEDIPERLGMTRRSRPTFWLSTGIAAACLMPVAQGVEWSWHRVDLDAGKVIATLRGSPPHAKISGNRLYELTREGVACSSWPERRHLWRFPVPQSGAGGWQGIFLTADHVLYQIETKVIAIGRDSGRMAYEINGGGLLYLWKQPFMEENDTLFLMHAKWPSFRARAYEMKTGKRLWEREFDGLPRGAPGDSASGEPYKIAGSVVCLRASPKLWVIDPKTGSKRSEITVPGDTRHWRNWLHSDSRTLITVVKAFEPGANLRGGWDVVTGFDLASGKVLWTRKRELGTTMMWQEVGAKMAIAGPNGLCLYDRRTGKEQWPAIRVEGRPVAMARGEDAAFFLKTEKRLYKTQLESGKVAWSAPVRPVHKIRFLDRGVLDGGMVTWVRSITSANHILVHGAAILDPAVTPAAFSPGRPQKILLVVRSLDTGTVVREIVIQERPDSMPQVVAVVQPGDGRHVNVFICSMHMGIL